MYLGIAVVLSVALILKVTKSPWVAFRLSSHHFPAKERGTVRRLVGMVVDEAVDFEGVNPKGDAECGTFGMTVGNARVSVHMNGALNHIEVLQRPGESPFRARNVYLARVLYTRLLDLWHRSPTYGKLIGLVADTVADPKVDWRRHESKDLYRGCVTYQAEVKGLTLRFAESWGPSHHEFSLEVERNGQIHLHTTQPVVRSWYESLSPSLRASVA
jgi:hypothetical protein